MGPIGNNRGRRRALVAEINVTPLVDVMLVLLIIFMVTAPMMTQGLDVNLPATTNKALRQQEDPLTVSLKKNGDIYLGKIKVDAAVLRQDLGAMSMEQKKNPIYLRADEAVPYGLVMELMSDIRESGFNKLGMITRPAEK